MGQDAWRWMLGIQAVPLLLYFLLVFFVPESPRWLVKYHKKDEAKRVLESVGEPNPTLAIETIQESLQLENTTVKENLFNGSYNKPILYVVVLAMFNQLSGINAIMYYAPRIFEMTV